MNNAPFMEDVIIFNDENQDDALRWYAEFLEKGIYVRYYRSENGRHLILRVDVGRTVYEKNNKEE